MTSIYWTVCVPLQNELRSVLLLVWILAWVGLDVITSEAWFVD